MSTTSDVVRFHLSLNVSDLPKAIAFYRALLGVEPAKVRPDYAKFEPDVPPLVLSLEPTPRPVGGPLNHAGLRMPDAASLVAVQARLEAAGLKTNREAGVECCYARQTKFWVTDPDGTLWEVYTFDGDLEHRGTGQTLDVMVPNGKPASARIEWEHRLGSPVPERIPLESATADEVRFRGSFNLPLRSTEQKRLVEEAVRVLKPGGRLFVHTLVAERALAQDPGLPGPAASVRHTPVENEPLRLVESAGLIGARLIKYDAAPCFVRYGVPLREQQLEAFKPAAVESGAEVEVLYKGPFAAVEELGHTFPRGLRVPIPAGLVASLPGGNDGTFLVLPPSQATAACGTH